MEKRKMTKAEQKKAAKEFSLYWQDKGYEKGESQSFWLALLSEVLGVVKPEQYIRFEDQVKLDKSTGFIDGYIAETRVMIEQKSRGKDLNRAIRQSDGSLRTPFEQAKNYISELPLADHPKWVVTSNFEEIWVYNMNRPHEEPEKIRLDELETDYYRLAFLVDTEDDNLRKELEVSVAAGDIVGKIYDALAKQYNDPDSAQSKHSLNVLCVRLVFCLYAEDAGIFARNQFHDYMQSFKTGHMRRALIDLFCVLDTPEKKRKEIDPYMEDDLAGFPYVDGGLFADEDIEIPTFTEEIRHVLLVDASENFDWSDISPTIFGAVFESTLNPETRRKGGMHYTSIENIHKVIDPLFLDDLKAELDEILALPDKTPQQAKTKRKKLEKYQNKLANLVFLDPACGSGNFLTETYLSLRRLENRVITELINLGIFGKAQAGQVAFGQAGTDFDPIKVSISQFYGIEINDFAVTVARTALWIAESQMMQETEQIINMPLNFLPLTTNASIVKDNALRIDWNEVVPKWKLNYIMGNPPFSGARIMSSAQKDDVNFIFSGWKNAGNLDYVSCWFKKASDFIAGTDIRCAFVSTKSITQGEQVSILWKPLFENGVHIDFAYHSFRWDSEATIKAHVFCVIIGFSVAPNSKSRILYDGTRPTIVKNINAYLLDAENVIIESRNKPLCDVPEIGMGNQPIDDGNYLFTNDEKESFVKKEPKAEKYFHPWYGSRELINRSPRYCLWLGECSPAELRSMPECMKRVEAVRKYRLSSKRKSTLKLADNPTRFQTENMPKSNYIAIPEVSSAERRYIPMGYMDESILCSNKLRLMPDATLYHFGILESNVHMAWMRIVCGRLKGDYDYSIKIVYNNFPWPNPTPEQKAKIEKTAQEILEARALYPDSSLADLYDDAIMPHELRTAHRENDKAVMQAYGFADSIIRAYIESDDESEIVPKLMKMYQQLTAEK